MELVFRLAERITVLVGGKVLTEGVPAEIAADPRVREVYLGEAQHGWSAGARRRHGGIRRRHCAGGRVARAGGGRQSRAPRPQRHGQDDPAGDADGAHAPAWRDRALARRRSHGPADISAKSVWTGLGAARALHIPVAHRRGASDGCGAARSLDRSESLRPLSPPRTKTEG